MVWGMGQSSSILYRYLLAPGSSVKDTFLFTLGFCRIFAKSYLTIGMWVFLHSMAFHWYICGSCASPHGVDPCTCMGSLEGRNVSPLVFPFLVFCICIKFKVSFQFLLKKKRWAFFLCSYEPLTISLIFYSITWWSFYYVKWSLSFWKTNTLERILFYEHVSQAQTFTAKSSFAFIPRRNQDDSKGHAGWLLFSEHQVMPTQEARWTHCEPTAITLRNHLEAKVIGKKQSKRQIWK